MYQVASTGAKKGHHTEKGGLHQVLYLKNTADATNEQFLFRKREVLLWDMVDKSISHHSTYFRLFFVSGQSR